MIADPRASAAPEKLETQIKKQRRCKPSRERRAEMQAERGEPRCKPRKASRDSSRETQAEMKFGRTAAPNCVLRTELRGADRTAWCGPNCVVRTELRGADRTTCYGTECAPAHRGIDTRCDSKACGRRARGIEGLTSDATRRRVAEEHADEVTPDATRRRVAEEHAGGSVDIRCDSKACGRRARGWNGSWCRARPCQ